MSKTEGKKRSSIISYPANLIKPIGDFLRRNLKKLERQKQEIEGEDPFQNEGRSRNTASPDTGAAEQFGHAQIQAISSQIDRKIIQTKKALSRIKIGKYGICEDCGNMIDTDRLMIYPEATFCANCQKKRE